MISLFERFRPSGKLDWRWLAEAGFLLILVGLIYFRHDTIDRNFARQQELFYTSEVTPSATMGHRVYVEPDSYTWITLCKEMIDKGLWRINYTFSDNHPDGREVHWNALLMWILIGMAHIRAFLTDETIYAALENGAYQVNFWQFMVVGVLWYSLMRRFLGRWPTLVGLCLFALVPSSFWSFHPGRPDHQTLHFIAALGSILCLLRGGLGWTRSDDSPPEEGVLERPSLIQARWYFRIAGLFGGLGMWVGSTVQLTLLFFAGVTALGLVFCTPRDEVKTGKTEGLIYQPSLWREWALWGTCATLVFYLIQYFPNDMGMRLEAIHPLYAVSWLGGGWVLSYIGEWWFEQKRAPWKRIEFFGAGIAMLIWPLASKLGPQGWHILRDEVVLRFQTRTTEGMPLPMVHGAEWKSMLFYDVTILPIVLVLVPLLALKMRLNRHEWTLLFFAWVTAMGYFILGYWQGRWLMFAVIGLIVALGCLLVCLPRLPNLALRFRVPLLALLVCLGMIAFYGNRAVQEVEQIQKDQTVMPVFLDGLLWKRMADELKREKPEGEISVLIDPTAGPPLYYFRGIKSVGSLFWQNAYGLRSFRDFFVSTDDEIAEGIVDRHEVDFVVVYDMKASAIFPIYLKYGENYPKVEGDFLVDRMMSGRRLPPWLSEDFQLTSRLTRPFKVNSPSEIPIIRAFRVDRSAVEDQ